MGEMYDVIVIGSGFGGPAAAKKCADAGLRTLMIERSAAVGGKGHFRADDSDLRVFVRP